MHTAMQNCVPDQVRALQPANDFSGWIFEAVGDYVSGAPDPGAGIPGLRCHFENQTFLLEDQDRSQLSKWPCPGLGI